jgi:hypothetical protein
LEIEMKIYIIVPFEGSETQTGIWAYDEDIIDFRKQITEAVRCTTAFAATELKYYLSLTCPELHIDFVSQWQQNSYCVELKVLGSANGDSGFVLEPVSNGLKITGNSRVGLIYGVYEFLRIQGWRWYAPGGEGEIAPPHKEVPIIPDSKMVYQPSMFLLRGFDFEGVSKESAQLLLWMARNRLNLCGYRPSTAALARKLGMKLKIGGHIFDTMLNPDRQLSNGNTLWEKHHNWYGLPADGLRRKEQAFATQFCVSQIGLREFLAGELIELLIDKWRHADIIDIWGFDTWGNSCCCSDCTKLGNSSDQALFFLSSLRTALDVAREHGKLSYDVQMTACAYEGTATIECPQNPIPINLAQSGDIVAFYPINRCYVHDIASTSCDCNSRYLRALNSWTAKNPTMPVMVGEYYNVSRFEDLPLLFTNRINNDIQTYHNSGACAMTYMHIPMVNWAMRTLTQNLYAQMCWQVNTDVGRFLNEYFSHWYGTYCNEMRSAYDLIEQAWLHISDWRSWGAYSALAQLKQWDGTVPRKPLFTDICDCHFTNTAKAIESGRNSIILLQKAMSIIDHVQQQDRIAAAQNTILSGVVAVNPIEARRLEQAGKYEMRIGEDRRLLIYGIDSLSMLVELITYYNALYLHNSSVADICWENIEILAAKLDSYYIPIDYEIPGAGLIGKDALTRTQVRELLRRCRKYQLDSIGICI